MRLGNDTRIAQSVRLDGIASVQSGLWAETDADGEIVYLQAKHFGENGQLVSTLHPDMGRNKISEKHLLRDGDVLFAAKGTKNFAAWYESKNPPAVASTSFFVIRINEAFQDKVLPAFLAWYINQPAVMKLLKGKAIGTSIVSISKSVLEELVIMIPPLETQNVIISIMQLRNREKDLTRKIEMLREKQIHQQILNAIK
jgi:restriction endonuclease S subunit